MIWDLVLGFFGGILGSIVTQMFLSVRYSSRRELEYRKMHDEFLTQKQWVEDRIRSTQEKQTP